MSTAPLFSLKDQNNVPFVLEEALKKGPVVIFFYPKDQTRICSLEVRGFHSLNDRFVELGAQVVGISSDSTSSHKRFVDNCGPSIRLLSDKGGKVRKAFGVRAHLILIPGRETFVIDQNRNIVFNIRNFNDHNTHIDRAMEAVKVLRTTL